MSRSTLWAVVPVKSFASAKQRLAPVLTAQERAALARAMLQDVLQVLVNSPFVAGTLVVTADIEAATIARHARASVLPEPFETGLVPAIQHAARALAAEGRGGMLVVPADLPTITSADIELIALGHRRSPAVTLVAATSDGGTNALACSPPDAIPFSFGENSFQRHRDSALDRHLSPKVLTLPRFGRDIDRPEDLLAFLACPSATRTYAFLRDGGIARRLRQIHAGKPARTHAPSLELAAGASASRHPKG